MLFLVQAGASCRPASAPDDLGLKPGHDLAIQSLQQASEPPKHQFPRTFEHRKLACAFTSPSRHLRPQKSRLGSASDSAASGSDSARQLDTSCSKPEDCQRARSSAPAALEVRWECLHAVLFLA